MGVTGGDDVVLWWALALIVVVAFTTYRPYLVAIFWNPSTPQSSHLFNQNPIDYAAGQFGHAIGSAVGGLLP